MKPLSRPLFSFLSIASLFAALPGSLQGQDTARYQIMRMHYVQLSQGAGRPTSHPIKTVETVKNAVSGDNVQIVIVDPTVIVHPSLAGLGGAFNEQGGEAFMHLPEAQRKNLAEALFNPKTGAGLSLCRTAIGSSDFGLGAYSYSETPDDYTMAHFSVERDTKSVIPFILAAKAENPELRIFASPWSPPGWMKQNGSMTQKKGKGESNKNVLKSDPKIYAAYALYFSKYAQAYAKHGVQIERITIQNEPDMNPVYPGCDMQPEQMSELVTRYIRPQFDKDGVKTEIWAGTFRGIAGKGARNDAAAFMKLEGAKLVAGLGLQYVNERILNVLHKAYPDKPLMHTEGACYDGKNTIQQACARFGEVATWLYNGTENYCYWNMVLNESESSAWGWKQNSLATVDRTRGEVTYNNDFAVIALLSKFIRPGDQLLKIQAPEKQTAIAVKNGKRLVVFLQNNGDKAVTQKIQMPGESVPVELPPNSLCAFEFKTGTF
jgi:glucosylceramidase